MLNKTSVFLIIHAVILISVFTLRFMGIAPDYILIAVAAVMSLEAIYVALFTKAVAKRAASNLKEMAKEMAQIREEAYEATKLHRSLIYAGHQIKTIQGDLDLLKRGLKPNGNGHRRPHHPLISHS